MDMNIYFDLTVEGFSLGGAAEEEITGGLFWVLYLIVAKSVLY